MFNAALPLLDCAGHIGSAHVKSLFNRLFGFGAVAEEPAPGKRAETLEWLRSHIDRDVASGFYDEDEILKNSVAAFEDELDGEDLRKHAQAHLKRALAAHAADQKNWPAHTDCDRLDAAFEELEAEGVISRQNFSCCGTCGSSEIWDEIAAVEEGGSAAHGYAFYHMQDTESAAEGDGLYLNYGACAEGEEAAVAIGHEIVSRLEEHGLSTDWDGRWETRIRVDLDWKRRRGLV
jgi:hypothetical protein